MIKDFIKNKSLAIVGNGESDESVIEKYDVIVRMNRPRHIGRTDILCIAYSVDEELLKKLNPRYIMWVNDRRHKIKKHIIHRISLYYPIARWEELQEKLEARPTTGCIAIDYFSKLTLNWNCFGFDFEGFRRTHNAQREREYIDSIRSV